MQGAWASACHRLCPPPALSALWAQHGRGSWLQAPTLSRWRKGWEVMWHPRPAHLTLPDPGDEGPHGLPASHTRPESALVGYG